MMINLTASQLRQAADLKEKIAALEAELGALFGGTTLVLAAATLEIEEEPAAEEPARPGKRKFSAAHIAKIRAAQKLRWAKHKAAKHKTAAEAIGSAKRGAPKGMTMDAAKARIPAAQKARLARIKTGKSSEAPAKTVAKTRKMSAAGRAAISAATKARWAKYNAAKK